MSKLIFFFFALIAIAAADVVTTKYGPVSGYTTDTHKVWKGIPFAAAPVGALRWQPPQAPTSWTDAKNTSAFGSICVQSSGGVVVGSEDCLFINVWVPKNANLSNPTLPVLAYIYGGSFTGGKSNDFDGEFLSGEDVIYVNFNYRVGALGFLYHPALAETNSQRTSGFYGMQDQRFAFQWIRDNIAAFGGNPNRLTVSGESAGAISLCLHLAASRSTGTFDKAISQSGFCTTFTQAEGTLIGNFIASKLNCSGSTVVECLKAATPAQLVPASSAIAVFYPTSHPYEIGDSPISVIQSGNYNKVPLMGGTNLNESSYIFCLYYKQYTYDQFVAYVNASYVSTTVNRSLTDLLNLYNVNNYPSPVSAMIAIAADRSFKCFTKALFQANVAASIPTYMYSFDIHPSFSPDACFGAAHAYELNFLYPKINSQALTAGEQALSKTMRDAWVSFTVDTVPTVAGQAWPAYSSREDYVVFDLTISNGTDFLEHFCPIWDLPSIHSVAVTLPTIPAGYPIWTNSSSSSSSTTSSPTSTTGTNNSPSSSASSVGHSILMLLIAFVLVLTL